MTTKMNAIWVLAIRPFEVPMYKMKCQCKSPIKWGKREKARGKKPPPKREMKEDVWMDGIIKTPRLQHTFDIYIREKWEEEERQKRLIPKRRMLTSDASDEEADPRLQKGVPPLRKKQGQGRCLWNLLNWLKNLSQRTICHCNWWRTLLRLLTIRIHTHFNL